MWKGLRFLCWCSRGASWYVESSEHWTQNSFLCPRALRLSGLKHRLGSNSTSGAVGTSAAFRDIFTKSSVKERRHHAKIQAEGNSDADSSKALFFPPTWLKTGKRFLKPKVCFSSCCAGLKLIMGETLDFLHPRDSSRGIYMISRHLLLLEPFCSLKSVPFVLLFLKSLLFASWKWFVILNSEPLLWQLLILFVCSFLLRHVFSV